MNRVDTKFGIGEVVYHASTVTIRKQHACPDCLGSKVWKGVSPAGKEYEFACPRCASGYQSNRDCSLDYSEFEGTTRRLTIGSIRTDSNADRPVSYMCHETGVGSGSVYYEEDLYRTDDEAKAAAALKASEQNVEVPWVAELYNATLKLSDYEIKDAAAKAAEDRAIKSVRAHAYLIEDIEGCTDYDQVRALIEAFRSKAEAA